MPTTYARLLSLVYDITNAACPFWIASYQRRTTIVVKRFFKLEEDDVTVITTSAHNTHIQAEIGRLALAKWFFDAFIKRCANGNVIINESV
jgi:hypothetical protein